MQFKKCNGLEIDTDVVKLIIIDCKAEQKKFFCFSLVIKKTPYQTAKHPFSGGGDDDYYYFTEAKEV